MRVSKIVKAPEGKLGAFRVIKPGSDVVNVVKAVLKQLDDDQADLILFYDKVLKDPEFASTREYPALMLKALSYQERYGVQNKSDFDKLYRRYRFIAQNFSPKTQYEFTIDQLVELGF